ncbi:MAG TPA: MarR family winged helix-turn-helix transcriptional regulator [Chakrabartia sp.]|nr:MarR family winged helix-turn-helix transcriptional regulator [Chakrabartia sp.]
MKIADPAYLIIPLLQGWEWFDDGLQHSLRQRGWTELTRPESMVMIHVILGMRRPTEIARSLGLTRQAIHRTIGIIREKGLFVLLPDPDDGRGSLIGLTEVGEAMRTDAQHIVRLMFAELVRRIGEKRMNGLIDALTAEWGASPAFGKDDRLIR